MSTISLALQGGGAHGAFTWGVLDRLLEDGRLPIEGISGTSAGAMNAVMLAQGFAHGGAEAARQTLADFWQAVAALTPRTPFDSYPFTARSDSDAGHVSPLVAGLLELSRNFSPQQLNPFDINPLRDIVDQLVDFDLIIRRGAIKLFIVATHLDSGKMRIFTNPELCTDVVLASACLPPVHHPIEIDGKAYWDGGFSGNPAVFPLVYDCRSRDVVLVLLDPLQRPDIPRTAEEIRRRMSDISLNATFLREMRAIARVRREVGQRLIALGSIERRIKGLRFHLLDPNERSGELAYSSRFNTNADFLFQLRDLGRARAARWLEHYHRDRVAAQINIDALFG